MPAADELRVLARAYTNQLVSVEQISDLLRELGKDDNASLSLLLESLGLLSQEQIAALVESSRFESRQPATSRAGSLPVSEIGARTTRGMARSSTVRSDPTADTQDFTPAPAGGQQADDWPTLPSEDAPVVAKSLTPEVEARQRYVLMSELGRGGLGRVRLALDQQLGREVAVKDLLPQSLHAAEKIRRFLDEARVTGQLEHPGIVPVYSAGLDSQGNPFYAMKRIGGRTLSQAIREYHRLDSADRSKPQRFSELLTVFVSICRTMAFAHQRGVLHRDLKPQNIIVGDFGEAIVVDWGLAKHFASATDTTLRAESLGASTNGSPINDDLTAAEDAAHTRAGTIVGTIPYMSPEQALAQPLDARSDVYALGAILFDMLTGSAPFRGERRDVLRRVQRGKVPRPRSVSTQVPRALEAICLHAMARQAEDRYQSALELADDVVRYQAGEPVRAYPEPWYDRSLRWIKRHRTMVLTAAASAAVFAVVYGAWLQKERRDAARNVRQAVQLAIEARDALAKNELDTAKNLFDQAHLILARVPREETRLAELDHDRAQVSEKLERKRADDQATQQLGALRRQYDEALFRTMLASRGVHGDGSNSDQLRQASMATNLADFASAQTATQAGLQAAEALLKPAPGKAPLVELLSPAERTEIAGKAREFGLAAAELAAIDPHVPDLASRAQAALALLAEVTVEPPLRAFYQRRARYHLLAGDAEQASADQSQAESIPPKESLDLFLLGDERLAADDYAAAARHFADSLKLDPDRFWAQYFLAAAQLQMGQPRDALANLTACISRRTEFAWCYLLRGLAQGELGEISQAEEDYQRALELFGPAAPVQDLYALHLNRGITRLRAGRFQQAIEDFDDAHQFDRSRVEALINLAEAHRRLARQVGIVAHASAPASLPAIDALAAVNQPSFDLLTAAIQLAPRDPQPLLARGRLHRMQGNLAAATQDFRHALGGAPPGSRQRALVLCELGRVQHLQQHFNEALANYQAAIDECEDYADAWYLQALALMDTAQPAKALLAFDRFLNGGAELPPGATPLSAVDVLARASRSISAGPSTQGEDVDAAVRLAVFLRERAFARLLTEDYSGGLTDAEVVTSLVRPRMGGLTPADRDRFALLDARRGWLYLLMQAKLKGTRAIEAFDKAIQNGAFQGEPLTGRASTYITLGQYREAIADAAQAVEIGPPVTGLLYNAASVYAAARPLVERDQQVADRATLSAAWLAESVALLRRAFEQADARTRAAYWTELDRDTFFDSIRDTAELKQLRGEFDPRGASGK